MSRILATRGSTAGTGYWIPVPVPGSPRVEISGLDGELPVPGTRSKPEVTLEVTLEETIARF